MAESFADLRKKTQEINEKVKTGEFGAGGGGRQDDPRLWYPTRDGDGIAEAVIRFLPPSKGSNVPFISMYTHRFKGPRGWFIENCPTTIGKECPVCESNGEHWNSGVESDKDIARERKRKISYYANVLVIKDPRAPENEGQVRVLKFGAQIHKIIMRAAKPKFEHQKSIQPFDPWEQGANFFMRITKDEDSDQTTYVESEFDRPGRMFPTDDEIEAIWHKQHDLQEFVPDSIFLEFDELKAKFDRSLGKTSPQHSGPRREEKEEKPKTETRSEAPPSDDRGAKEDAQKSSGGGNPTDDDIMAHLQSLESGGMSEDDDIPY